MSIPGTFAIGFFDGTTSGVPILFNPNAVSLSFNGLNENIANFNSQAIEFGYNDNFTIAAWVRLNVFPSISGSAFFDIDTDALSGKNRIALEITGSAGAFKFQSMVSDGVSASETLTGVNNISLGVWYLVVLIKDKLTPRNSLYVNTTEEAFNTVNTIDQTGQDALRGRSVGVARTAFAFNYVPLNVHYIAMWNKVLSSAEINTIYNAGSGYTFDLSKDSGSYASSANLIHWWRLGANVLNIGQDYASKPGGSGHIDVATFQQNITIIDVEDRNADAPGTENGFIPSSQSVNLAGTKMFRNNMDAPSATFGISDAFSLSVWVKLNSSVTTIPPAGVTFMNMDDLSGSSPFSSFFNFNIGNTVTASVSTGGTSDTITGSDALSVNQWALVTMVKETFGNKLRLYINDLLDIVSSIGSLNFTNKDVGGIDISLGGNTSGSGFSDITIYQAAMWNKALTAQEVQLLYNNGNGKAINLNVNTAEYTSSSNLIHYWRFGDDSVNIGADTATNPGGSGAIDLMANNIGITSADILTSFGDAPGN